MIYYTHAGRFHCDEVMGYAICELVEAVNEFERLEDLSLIKNIEIGKHIIADIGRVWDTNARQFDHHQGWFPRPNGVPLATAGMIWQFYGQLAVRYMIPMKSDQFITEVANRVDRILIQGLDANDADNDYEVHATCNAGKINAMTLPDIVRGMNHVDVNNHQLQRTAFKQAARLCNQVLQNTIREATRAEEAKEELRLTVGLMRIDRNVNSGYRKDILFLEKNIDWYEAVHELYPQARYVIAPSQHPGNPWSMTAVPEYYGTRKVKTAIERPDWFEGFIHQGKWIAGGKTPGELEALALWNLENAKQKV